MQTRLQVTEHHSTDGEKPTRENTILSKAMHNPGWNEWTEGSYLEPDQVHGMKYLEAVREVFPPARTSGRGGLP